MINFFDNNPWLNILFLILSIFSIVLAYYFYHKAKREKKPVFNAKTISLFQANPLIAKKIEIKYKGSPVESLSLTRLAFWNAGRESIRAIDIAPNSPFLIIAPEDVNIFEVEIIDQYKVNNFKIEQLDEHKIKITFDYIDFNDGVIINILHTKFKQRGLTIHGIFIGAKKLSRGIQEHQISEKFDFITKPINYLFNKKGIISRILGGLLAIPTIALYLPIIIITLPIDMLLNKYSKKFQKKYLLEDVIGFNIYEGE